MGNCLERWNEEGEEMREETGRGRGALRDDGDDSDDDDDDACVSEKPRGMKVKIVLTRHELEMFLLQLSENYDGKLMMSKDAIAELQRKISSSSSSSSSLSAQSSSSSSSSVAWKPSLESIMECPEIQEMDR